MVTEVIYEKCYLDTASVESLPEPLLATESEPLSFSVTFEEIYKRILNDTTFIPIPSRIKNCEVFIQTAIKISKLYTLDTKIVRHHSHISVDYSFNAGGGMRDIRHVFAMADEFSFFKDINGLDITISMNYYTHMVVRNGSVIAPDANAFDFK